MIACGATDSRERSGGVAFTGSLETAYRACLWSRIANRVFLEVAQFEAADAEEFLAAVHAHRLGGASGAWRDAGLRLQRPAPGHHAHAFRRPQAQGRHRRCAARRQRRAAGHRARAPRRARARARARHAHHRLARPVGREPAPARLPGSGRRGAAEGERRRRRADARAVAGAGSGSAELLDPLCGSGTFCIEAALIAADRAPGLTREYFGFLGWRGHDAAAVGAAAGRGARAGRARAQATAVTRARPGPRRGGDPQRRARTPRAPASSAG